jgi:hypothetical protein
MVMDMGGMAMGGMAMGGMAGRGGIGGMAIGALLSFLVGASSTRAGCFLGVDFSSIPSAAPAISLDSQHF